MSLGWTVTLTVTLSTTRVHTVATSSARASATRSSGPVSMAVIRTCISASGVSTMNSSPTATYSSAGASTVVDSDSPSCETTTSTGTSRGFSIRSLRT